MICNPVCVCVCGWVCVCVCVCVRVILTGTDGDEQVNSSVL